MDQQLEAYERNLKAFFEKVKSMVFVNLPKQHRWWFTAIILFTVYITAFQVYYDGWFAISVFNNINGNDLPLGEMIYSVLIVLFTLSKSSFYVIGVVLAPFGKKWGWVGLCMFAFHEGLWQLVDLMQRINYGKLVGDGGAITGILYGDQYSGGYLEIISWFVLYIVIARYLFTNTIEHYFQLKKRAWLIPFGILMGILAVESITIYAFGYD